MRIAAKDFLNFHLTCGGIRILINSICYFDTNDNTVDMEYGIIFHYFGGIRILLNSIYYSDTEDN